MAYLMNAWYAVAWSDEIGSILFGRTLLGRPVVLFRDTEGTITALGGRCPHRWSLKPVLLEGDAAGVRARRTLGKMIADEQATPP